MFILKCSWSDEKNTYYLLAGGRKFLHLVCVWPYFVGLSNAKIVLEHGYEDQAY